MKVWSKAKLDESILDEWGKRVREERKKRRKERIKLVQLNEVRGRTLRQLLSRSCMNSQNQWGEELHLYHDAYHDDG